MVEEGAKEGRRSLGEIKGPLERGGWEQIESHKGQLYMTILGSVMLEAIY